MSKELFNEHDANQGAQSRGEFLGMTGNSAWYLLGSAGASVLLLIVLWGVLGFSLLVCLGLGATLCALSVAYVFALKNNRPAHYDTDFFESVLIESGVLPLAFGPSGRRPSNPFRSGETAVEPGPAEHTARAVGTTRGPRQAVIPGSAQNPGEMMVEKDSGKKRRREKEDARTVPLPAYERLQERLNAAEEALDDALAAHEEDSVCV